MVRITYFLSLALAAQGLHAAPTVSGAQGDLQTRGYVAGEQRTGIVTRQAGGGGIAKAPAPNNNRFPSDEVEAQRQGNRGSITFKDTPDGKAAAAAAERAAAFAKAAAATEKAAASEKAAAAERAGASGRAGASDRAGAFANAGANAAASQDARKAAAERAAAARKAGGIPTPIAGETAAAPFRGTPAGRAGN